MRASAGTERAALDSELRRLKSRLAEAESALEAGRRAAREGRSVEDMRVRLLLDTVLDAAQGLRRELALPPSETRPADTVDAVEPGRMSPKDVAARALSDTDPALLDQLLALPQAHLVVDGYNVTKTGYPALPLEKQRLRLLGGLAVLAAQSGAEVTCVFDGAELAAPVLLAPPRGVRVLFSKPGQTADELIRRLVRADRRAVRWWWSPATARSPTLLCGCRGAARRLRAAAQAARPYLRPRSPGEGVFRCPVSVAPPWSGACPTPLPRGSVPVPVPGGAPGSGCGGRGAVRGV